MEIKRGSGNHKNTLKTAFNDVTGDNIKSGKGSQEVYGENLESIFGERKRREYTWDDFPPVGPEQEKAAEFGITREEFLAKQRVAG